MKTSELTGAALDWAVARCEDYHTIRIDTDTDGTKRINYGGMYPEWSSDWEYGGQIIENEGISLQFISHGLACGRGWAASLDPLDADEWVNGPTPLIAAMRAYVHRWTGGEMEIPKELT